jgi:predicted Ser/Thr protein kinase
MKMEWNDEDLGSLMGNVGSYEPGEKLGQDYEVLELLGKGGQGEVYKVRNNKDGHTYVAKIFIGDEGNRQFEHEQGVFLKLKGTKANPHILRGHPATATGKQKVLILDYLEGPTLREYLQSNGPSPALASEVGREILEALRSIHERGVAHRDVKPSNIKLVEGRGAVLFDFGIATSEEDDGSSSETPLYAPPEKDTSVRRDIYSLGVVMHEAATGRRPLWKRGGSSPADQGDQLVHPPELWFRPALSYCINTALRWDPDDRFSGAAVFRRTLTLRALPITVLMRWMQLARRGPLWSGMLVGVSAFLVLLGSFLAWRFPLQAVYVREMSRILDWDLERYSLNPSALKERLHQIVEKGDIPQEKVEKARSFLQWLDRLDDDLDRARVVITDVVCVVERPPKEEKPEPSILWLRVTFGDKVEEIKLRRYRETRPGTKSVYRMEGANAVLSVWERKLPVIVELCQDGYWGGGEVIFDLGETQEHGETGDGKIWTFGILQPMETQGEIRHDGYNITIRGFFQVEKWLGQIDQ